MQCRGMTLQIATGIVAPKLSSVAGLFFPASADELAVALQKAERGAAPGYARPWSAIIAPHAGYRFSGAVAASIYRTTAAIRQTCRRVILFSPAHKLAFKGMATLDAPSLTTPLGSLPVDRAALADALGLGDVQLIPQAFEAEHGIETQLPFIQTYLPLAKVLPIVVGQCAETSVGAVMRRFAGASDTLIVVSTDLSHFHALAEARRLDAETCKFIERVSPEPLGSTNACGVLPLRALLALARDANWRVTRFDARTSADAGADPGRVVGYAAYGLEPAADAQLPDAQRALLLDVARRSLAFAAAKGSVPAVKASGINHPLGTLRRVFVTLTNNGQLRGCQGSLTAQLPVLQGVATYTALSAISDHRFKPVTVTEVEGLKISISVLSEEAPIASATKAQLIAALQPGIDGLTLSGPNFRATFLPKVWATLPDPAAFVAALMRKAGLSPETWSDEIRCARYRAECFGDV